MSGRVLPDRTASSLDAGVTLPEPLGCDLTAQRLIFFFNKLRTEE